MRRHVLYVAVMVLAAATADAQRRKAPWEWTLEERLTARCDPKLARARADRYREWASKEELSIKSGRRPSDNSGIVDVIDGKQNPELFLPHELFESLIRKGFVGDTWRDFMAEEIPKAGLPEDFWERLEHIAPALIDVMLRMDQLLEGGRNATEAERNALNEALTALHQDLCRERADALARAQAEFGKPLDRLLYGYLARIKSSFSPSISNRESLAFAARGCR